MNKFREIKHFPKTVLNFGGDSNEISWEPNDKNDKGLRLCFELDLDQIGHSKNYTSKINKMTKTTKCMKFGGIFSRRKSGQKRRREREKMEAENSQRSTDSGIGSEEERESNNELGAPRDTTAGEIQTSIVQSTAQDDSQSNIPRKKPKLSQEEKHELLDKYISSEDSNFTCFTTNHGLNNLLQAVQSHSSRCPMNLKILKPVTTGNWGLSSTIALNCECGWSKNVNTVGDVDQRDDFDKQYYAVLTILGLVASKMDSFLRLMNFGGQNLYGTASGIDSESKKNKKTRENVQDGIIEFKNSLENAVLDDVVKNYDPEDLPTFKADGFYDCKNAQICQGTLFVESKNGDFDKSAGTVLVKRQGFLEDVTKGKGIIVDLPSQSLEGVALEILMKRVRCRIPKFNLVLDGDVKVIIYCMSQTV